MALANFNCPVNNHRKFQGSNVAYYSAVELWSMENLNPSLFCQILLSSCEYELSGESKKIEWAV